MFKRCVFCYVGKIYYSVFLICAIVFALASCYRAKSRKLLFSQFNIRNCCSSDFTAFYHFSGQMRYCMDSSRQYIQSHSKIDFFCHQLASQNGKIYPHSCSGSPVIIVFVNILKFRKMMHFVVPKTKNGAPAKG